MTVVVVGASGLVGTAAVDAFLAAGWDVVAMSRRRPETMSDAPYRHITVDLRDADATTAALRSLSGITHVVYAAVHELPGLVKGWKSREQMDVNLGMLRNVLHPLASHEGLEHVTLLQGTKAYGVHHHPIRVPSREREPRDEHENFYWLQEDFVRAHGGEHGYGWTIFRPPLVVGPNYGVAMNLVPVIGAYAALRRAEGAPFSFPGGPSYVAEAVDVELLADAMVWATSAPQARNEHFNITNGEVFQWRDLWPALAEALGVHVGPDEGMRISDYLLARERAWDALVAQHSLRPLSLRDLLGESHYYADFQFAFGAQQPPPPALMSTVKLREAGFHGVRDTERSFQRWLGVLEERGILPPRG